MNIMLINIFHVILKFYNKGKKSAQIKFVFEIDVIV